MSATEYAVDESSYILAELINNLKNYDGIIFYSLLQLPIIKKNRFKVYASILKKNKQSNVQLISTNYRLFYINSLFSFHFLFLFI